ncbi:hypothetical protein ABPG75_004876 [Micractinium tetrahymenae]
MPEGDTTPAVATDGSNRGWSLLPKASLSVPRWDPAPGVDATQRPLSINADANAKASHYAACGASTAAAHAAAALPPLASAFFGSVRTIMESYEASQKEPESATGADEPASCEAQLSCARDTARAGGQLDERNISGAVCGAHGVPVRGLFMSSPAHEHFGQYSATVAVALALLPLLAVFVLDINCQFSKHLWRTLPLWAVRLRFYIDWLHAKAGHNLECQLAFNAMFGEGLGRLFGEGIEQLWAGLKPVFRVQRYEALPHRLVTLELALLHFASSKYSRFCELLAHSFRHAQRRKTQLQSELAGLLQRARELDFDVDPAADFQLADQAPLKLTTAQLYVKKLAAKDVYVSLTSSGGGAVIAGLDSSTGRALAVQVNDPSFMPKLEGELATLRGKLGIQGDDWLPSSDEYKVGRQGSCRGGQGRDGLGGGGGDS